MMRFALPVLVVCVLGAGVMWVQSMFATPDKGEKMRYVDEADRELQETLRELAGAWNPRKKRRVVARARSRVATISKPLLQLLERPRHPKLGAAMFLAAELKLETAKQRLVGLMQSAPRALRAEAALAAARIEPWSAEELEGLLTSSDIGLRFAGLLCWKHKPDPAQFSTVLEILEGRDQELSRAAVEALPEKLLPEQKKLMRERLVEQSGFARAMLLRALGRGGLERDDEALLVQALWDENDTLRRAALVSLTRKGSALHEPRAVLELIQNEASQEETALALYCLERTKSFSAIDIRNRVAMIEGALARYFAARCLVSRGQRQALPMLLSVLQAEGSDVPQGCDLEAVSALARTLLSRLSGKPLSTALSEWSTWVESGARFSPRQLDALDASQMQALGLAGF